MTVESGRVYAQLDECVSAWPWAWAYALGGRVEWVGG